MHVFQLKVSIFTPIVAVFSLLILAELSFTAFFSILQLLVVRFSTQLPKTVESFLISQVFPFIVSTFLLLFFSNSPPALSVFFNSISSNLPSIVVSVPVMLLLPALLIFSFFRSILHVLSFISKVFLALIFIFVLFGFFLARLVWIFFVTLIFFTELLLPIFIFAILIAQVFLLLLWFFFNFIIVFFNFIFIWPQIISLIFPLLLLHFSPSKFSLIFPFLLVLLFISLFWFSTATFPLVAFFITRLGIFGFIFISKVLFFILQVPFPSECALLQPSLFILAVLASILSTAWISRPVRVLILQLLTFSFIIIPLWFLPILPVYPITLFWVVHSLLFAAVLLFYFSLIPIFSISKPLIELLSAFSRVLLAWPFEQLCS